MCSALSTEGAIISVLFFIYFKRLAALVCAVVGNFLCGFIMVKTTSMFLFSFCFHLNCVLPNVVSC